MLPSTLKYLYSVEPVRMHFPMYKWYCHSIICTWENAFWLVQQNRDTWWQHGEKVGYCYPSGLEKTLCKWDINVPLFTEGLMIKTAKQWPLQTVSACNIRYGCPSPCLSKGTVNWYHRAEAAASYTEVWSSISFKMLMITYQTTRCHNLKDRSDNTILTI